MKIRELTEIIESRATMDGDRVKIRRSIAGPGSEKCDPFLLLDEISTDDAADYIGGFPEHPHRGFETVTYMLEGKMQHTDHLGNEGLLISGGVQWMTAGSGVLHAEMPQQERGRLHGFQLWINLPAIEKMQPARYQEFSAEQIPVVAIGERSQAKVIAGNFQSGGQACSGPVKGVSVQPDYWDMQLAQGDSLSVMSDPGKQVLLYVYRGIISVNGKTIKRQQLGRLGAGDTIEFSSAEDARLLLLSAIPINEPIVSYGPFVMNSREQIEQAILDYRSGRLIQDQPITRKIKGVN